MGMEGVLLKQAEEALRPYYKDAYQHAERTTQIIVQHCGIAGAAGLIPVPGGDAMVLLPSQIVMYGRLNKVMGISISKDTGKVIGKFMLSQILGILASFPVAAAGAIGGSLLKFIPFFGTLAGAAVTATSYAAITYVLGIVYVKALAKASQNGSLSEAGLKSAISAEFADKNKIHDLYEEAKKNAKGMDFKSYNASADDIDD